MRRTMSRRSWIGRGIALGSLAFSGTLRPAWAQQTPMDEIEEATPGQGAGPFYPVMKPLDRDADLTRVSGRDGQAEGQVVHLMGRVLNLDGRPVRNATIELWQANTGSDPNPAPMDPNFEGYAFQKTDDDGRSRRTALIQRIPKPPGPRGCRWPRTDPGSRTAGVVDDPATRSGGVTAVDQCAPGRSAGESQDGRHVAGHPGASVCHLSNLAVRRAQHSRDQEITETLSSGLVVAFRSRRSF